jgi:hypothetical protein
VDGVIGEAGRGDAGAFLSRLLRLDPSALVRLRPAGGDRVALWSMLPFRVLVVRTVAASVEADQTVAASDLLAGLDRPDPLPRRDQDWRWPLPPASARVVEELPAAEIARVAAAAEQTLRAAALGGVGGRPVGERALRDALLDHVPIVVSGADGERVEIPQRLVQAVVRMGFLAPSEDITNGHDLVTVRVAAGWIALSAAFGSAWFHRRSPFRLR